MSQEDQSVRNPADSSRCSRLSRRSTTLLIVIISILAYEAVSSHSASEIQADKVVQSSQPKESEASNLVVASAEKSSKQQERKQQADRGANKNKLSCEYHKAQWNFCTSDGSQTKVLRLKSGDRDCKANKTIRRDCETVGCKYARGQWSSACINGNRFRVDTLVKRIGAPAIKADCKPTRRVTKDCRRTCHYVKSGWSECVNGTQTRLLTLVSDESEPDPGPRSQSLFTSVTNNSDGEMTRLPSSLADSKSTSSSPSTSPKSTEARQTGPVADNHPQQCPSRKLIKRACRRAPGVGKAAMPRVSPTTPSVATHSTSSAPNGVRRSYQPSSSTTFGLTPASNNMTPAQKRRLKLMQAKQQQQSEGAKSATTVASLSTAENQPRAAESKSSARNRRR